jgi:ParB family transcriptional regulator, chromosome partitioning protein
MSKRGLGRGLDALLSATPQATERSTDLAISEIRPNPLQPRKVFAPAALDELVRSIKASGVIQPVVVRNATNGYELIAGERRWRAAKEAGLARIPAIVRDASDAEALQLALIENLLREDLNPMEEGEAFQRLIAEFGWTQDQLGERVGRDRSSVSNSLRLLRLPGSIQDDLRTSRLTMGHARAILALSEEADQLALRDEILAHSWSVRATEERVQKRRATPATRRSASPELRALEASLQRTLMTRVRITGAGRRGRIEVEYATAEELERLADLLGARD